MIPVEEEKQSVFFVLPEIFTHDLVIIPLSQLPLTSSSSRTPAPALTQSRPQSSGETEETSETRDIENAGDATADADTTTGTATGTATGTVVVTKGRVHKNDVNNGVGGGNDDS